MQELIGDIWLLRELNKKDKVFICIPTNMGWKSDGSNVIGIPNKGFTC